MTTRSQTPAQKARSRPPEASTPAGPAPALASGSPSAASRRTRQRDLIVDIFFSSTGHLSVDELLSKVQDRDENIGAATVYRTMKILADSGLASPPTSRTARPATRRPSGAIITITSSARAATPSSSSRTSASRSCRTSLPAARVPRHAHKLEAVRPLQGVPRRAVEALNTVRNGAGGFLARGRRACTRVCDPGSSCSARPSSRPLLAGPPSGTRAAFRTCAGRGRRCAPGSGHAALREEKRAPLARASGFRPRANRRRWRRPAREKLGYLPPTRCCSNSSRTHGRSVDGEAEKSLRFRRLRSRLPVLRG